jgi:hypothetical protein
MMIDWIQAPPPLGDLGDDALRERHLTLQKHLKLLRIVVPLVMFAIIAIGVLHIRATFQAIESAALAGAFEKQATRVLPKLQRAAAEVGEDVAPMVGEAFATQLDTAFERLSGRLDSEMKLLGDELPKQLEGQMQLKLNRANSKAADKLYEAFPTLRGDPPKVERLMASFQSGFSAWAGKTLTTTFARHLKELEAIKTTLNGFVLKQNQEGRAAASDNAAEGRHQARSKITPEQLLALWLEILDEALKGDGGDSDLFEAPVEAPNPKAGR